MEVDLTASGLDVWWDRELYAGDDFRDVILERLTSARAVVVIWSDTAVLSQWVCEEAGLAVRHNKLVPTHVGMFDRENLPAPFRSLHCTFVGDRYQLMRALVQFGLSVAGSEIKASSHVDYKQWLVDEGRRHIVNGDFSRGYDVFLIAQTEFCRGKIDHDEQAAIWYYLGMAKFGMKQYDEAFNCFVKADLQCPDNERIQEYLVKAEKLRNS